MSIHSVKLDEVTHLHITTLAAREGIAPHALMAQAVGGEPARIEERQSFVERARQAQARAEAGGPVHEGPAHAAHSRECVHAALNGSKPTTLAEVKKPAKARA